MLYTAVHSSQVASGQGVPCLAHRKSQWHKLKIYIIIDYINLVLTTTYELKEQQRFIVLPIINRKNNESPNHTYNDTNEPSNGIYHQLVQKKMTI